MTHLFSGQNTRGVPIRIVDTAGINRRATHVKGRPVPATGTNDMNTIFRYGTVVGALGHQVDQPV